ncbi:hypothetical protein ACIQNG_14860 [Streptomyces sp. NPDC091377]|uniref:hypothetical protein n=1 Tax=Streptomyces sp. NPDC091377 TaxID=3365995 RepID=UPI0038132A42
MHKRVTLGVVVSGALALSVLAVPAAQADGEPTGSKISAKTADAVRGTSADAQSTLRSSAAAAPLDITYSNYKVAKAIKVGTTAVVSTTVSYKITHSADLIEGVDFLTNPYLYKGDFDFPDHIIPSFYAADCTYTSATTANCSAAIDIDPTYNLINSDAGTWRGGAISFNEDETQDADKGALGTTLVQRNSKLTVNASPEPVKKGKTITVTGKLSRANWETGSYAGYASQSVKLQFRKKNASSYTTVKTVKTNSKGELKTTVKASQDGHFRYAFAGTSTTPAVNATGDYIDVK